MCPRLVLSPLHQHPRQLWARRSARSGRQPPSAPRSRRNRSYHCCIVAQPSCKGRTPESGDGPMPGTPKPCHASYGQERRWEGDVPKLVGQSCLWVPYRVQDLLEKLCDVKRLGPLPSEEGHLIDSVEMISKGCHRHHSEVILQDLGERSRRTFV